MDLREREREYSKEEIKLFKKYLLKCSASLQTRETQIKTTLRLTSSYYNENG